MTGENQKNEDFFNQKSYIFQEKRIMPTNTFVVHLKVGK